MLDLDVTGGVRMLWAWVRAPGGGGGGDGYRLDQPALIRHPKGNKIAATVLGRAGEGYAGVGYRDLGPGGVHPDEDAALLFHIGLLLLFHARSNLCADEERIARKEGV